jgi:membrane dipeptidase
MDRRQVTLGLTALALAEVATPFARAADAVGEGPVSPEARALYARSIVVDANLSPPIGDAAPVLSKASLDLVRGSGVTAMKTTIGGFNETFDDTVGELAIIQRVIEAYPDVFLQVRNVDDIARAKRENRAGIIFSFEGVAMLDGKLDRIDLFRDLGVRVMQLSYNDISPFAAGTLAKPETLGLTPLGHQAVERMNRLGVAVDLSHANAHTTMDAIAASSRPVLITHGGCDAVYPHPRNKTDAELRAVAGAGGVIGIYDLPYLTPSPRQPTLDDYVAHMTHALQVCGEDHVGIGSDQNVEPFDTSPKGMGEFAKELEDRRKAGIAAPGEDRPTYVVGLNTPRRCEVVADALLRRGYGARVTEKVLGANFVRAFGEIWGTEPEM